LTADEFFALTPRMFLRMRKEWWREQRQTMALFASLRVELVNRSMIHARDPVRIEDFLPQDNPDARAMPPKKPRMTDRRRQAIADRFRRVIRLVGRTAEDVEVTR
jgi:hypothetical protein